MPRTKHVPMRTCVGCRTQRPKRELARIVRSPSGSIELDREGKAPGRGAYVCPSRECVERARSARAVARSLRCEVPESFWSDLSDRVESESSVETSGSASQEAPLDAVPSSEGLRA